MSQSVRLCVYEIERVDAREGGREREKEREKIKTQHQKSTSQQATKSDQQFSFERPSCEKGASLKLQKQLFSIFKAPGFFFFFFKTPID